MLYKEFNHLVTLVQINKQKIRHGIKSESGLKRQEEVITYLKERQTQRERDRETEINYAILVTRANDDDPTILKVKESLVQGHFFS